MPRFRTYVFYYLRAQLLATCRRASSEDVIPDISWGTAERCWESIQLLTACQWRIPWRVTVCQALVDLIFVGAQTNKMYTIPIHLHRIWIAVHLLQFVETMQLRDILCGPTGGVYIFESSELKFPGQVLGEDPVRIGDPVFSLC